MRYLEIAASRKRGLNWDGVRDVPAPGCEIYDMTNLPMRGIGPDTYDGIYSEHFIEHLYKFQGINFLKECLRIMKPGGTLRTVWPPYEVVEWLTSELDLTDNEFVKHYYNFYIVKHGFAGRGNEHRRIQDQVAIGLLHQAGEHKYLWSEKELTDTLRSLGYVDVKKCEYGKSSLAEFNGIDTPGQIRAMHSVVLEARKIC
jgi:predicted SAM-dependent methyltransferase